MLPASRLTDRELSWLSFNERVLDLAADPSVPLLERVRFMAIFSSNLDEFYMVRVASVLSNLEDGSPMTASPDIDPSELMKAISARTHQLVSRQSRILKDEILPELKKHDIEIVEWDDLDSEARKFVSKIFSDRIFPVLTPLAVDPSHPFPYISGLSLNLAVIVKNPSSGAVFFARVKVPPILNRLIPIGPGKLNKFIPIESVIAIHLQELFPGMTIEDHYTFRVTRNQDLDLDEDDSENLLLSLEQELQRRRFGPPVRLEIEEGIDPSRLASLAEHLEINPENIISVPNPMDLTGFNRIIDLDLPELKFPPFRSRTSKSLKDVDSEDSDLFFSAIRQGEILLHHPYESFSSSVVAFLENAARDPHVLAIKQTLYRTSGDSPIVEALIEAAEAGKQVLAVIEIRARFDEQANVRWARKLESVGVHVVYGLMGLKTHAKLSLVIRDEASGIKSYCHIGTGNYNPKTARMYEDIGLLSSDDELTDDLSKLFNQLSGFAPQSSYSRLLVAPRTLRPGLIEKIDQEIQNSKDGMPCGIQFKLNSLLDEEFVEKLYEASQAGVAVDLLVRGICALKPGVPGLSENIKVRSILGRFLEHSRIFHFVNAGEDEFWIGSADLMGRNLDRRLESLVRIDKGSHQKYLQEIFDLGMSEDVTSWHLLDDTWTRHTHNEKDASLKNVHSLFAKRFKNEKH